MAFFFASASQWQTRKHIKELEARIQQLEARKTAAS
jgi:BMFP domain-containing protein YqiC